MKEFPLLILLVCAMNAADCSPAQAQIRVEPDKENVVASRVEGDWQVHAELTKRLTGNDAVKERKIITVKSDPSVVAKLPDKMQKHFANRRVYMAGIISIKGDMKKSHPFILVEFRGNPHVVWFRDRNGEAFGDAESFNVMMAAAQQRENDLLFIGGDFNNQPFSAFSRVKGPRED